MAQPIKNPNDARQGSREGVVRYVLATSLVLVVIGFIIAYIIAAP